MSKTKMYSLLKQTLNIVTIALIGCASIVFSVLYIETFTDGFLYYYSNILIAVSVSIISVVTVIAISFSQKRDKLVFKTSYLFIVLIFIAVFLLYIFKVTGVLDKFDSVEEFRDYINDYGGYAVFLFILLQFLQVVILPIPAFITVGAGVLLFGPLKGAIYSCIGIILGSILAFYVGRIFGVKVVKWLIGEENLKKGLKTIKGKDKIILTFMFLFPFFPDDIMCFVAGITSVSSAFFINMIFITRIISVFVSSFSMNNNILPYDTWWGIVLWIAFFVLTILFTVLIYKKGDKIEKFLFKQKSNKNHKKNK